MLRAAAMFKFLFYSLLLFHSFGDQLLRVVLYRPSWFFQIVLNEQGDNSCYFR